jgi:hypothetical protein
VIPVNQSHRDQINQLEVEVLNSDEQIKGVRGKTLFLSFVKKPCALSMMSLAEFAVMQLASTPKHHPDKMLLRREVVGVLSFLDTMSETLSTINETQERNAEIQPLNLDQGLR